MSTRLRDIASSALGRFGIPGIADVHILAPAAGGYGNDYWEKFAHSPRPVMHTDIETAFLGMVTGRNDVLLVTPDSHPQADTVTLSKNLTHVVGMVPPSRMNMRSRITQSATCSPLVEVSGYGNTLANLYLASGTAATDLNIVTISGDRNSLLNCHLLPSLATALDEADFDLLRLNCGEFFAQDCVFGGETVAWTDGNMLSIYGGGDRSNRSIFENCTFLMRADNAQVNFIEILTGAGNGFSFFKNCQFINLGTSLTYAIDGAGLGAHEIFFDNNCSFVGVDDIVAAGNEASVWFGGVNMPAAQVTGGASVALFNGIATHPDVS